MQGSNHVRKLPYSLSKTLTRTSNSSLLSPWPRNRPPDFYYCSYREKSRIRHPLMIFGGKILYSRTIVEVEEATQEILHSVTLKQKENGRAILGLDIEWRPTFKKGVLPNKAAVMQICGDNHRCYVMHIIHSGVPSNLQSLLEDPASTKVGIGIASDSAKIFKDYKISTKTLEDLSALANRKFGRDSKKWGLESLCKAVISKQLAKPRKIMLGNWEADSLSKEQLQYAATDAYASWYLYEVLQSLPDAVAENKKSRISKQPVESTSKN